MKVKRKSPAQKRKIRMHMKKMGIGPFKKEPKPGIQSNPKSLVKKQDIQKVVKSQEEQRKEDPDMKKMGIGPFKKEPKPGIQSNPKSLVKKQDIQKVVKSQEEQRKEGQLQRESAERINNGNLTLPSKRRRGENSIPTHHLNSSTENSLKPAIANVVSLAPMRQIIIQPSAPPILSNKAVTCKPLTVSIGTQTDADAWCADKVLLPVPVCIYVPVPMCMYTSPAPFPVPIPVPVAVPMCIPIDHQAAKELATFLREAKENIADHLSEQRFFSEDENDRESELDEALSLALQIANTDDAETDPENLTNDDTCVRIWSEFTNHKTDLLFSTSQELNSSLVIFLREVSKSDHPKYSREDILSICLGLQHFISDNNRPDCIFTDKAFSKFTTLLHKVLDVPPPTITDGQALCIDEDVLWETSQLGAHSPQVLLNTLVYFNMKYLKLLNFEDHLRISFSQYSIDWLPDGAGNFQLCLQHSLEADSPRKIVKENVEKPLQCFVKLFEFFSSRCPENVRKSNSAFYLLPESFCGPGNPAWYTEESLDQESLWKIFVKFCFVKQMHVS